MIDVDNISIELGGRAVVSGLSFRAEPGRLTAIVGPNGSGKTTTLKAISGERQFSGRIGFNGAPIASFTARELALQRAVLSQAITLGFPFTAREVLEMGIVAGDIHDAAEAGATMAEALAAVDLAGFETRIATRLSGGEQARLHMARVLCQIARPVREGKPCWLLLDEPVASLDIRHQMAIMALARTFARKGGGVIAVMHDLNLTAIYADHVVMLKDGRKHAEGTPREAFTEANLEAVYGCRLRIHDTGADMLRILPDAV